MDIHLVRTFLEIIAAGSFLRASHRLFVTQSAVSLRVRKLEAELGHQLFLRTKSGVELTPAGAQFERFARSLVRVWEEARYQVAIPEGFNDTLIIGSQYSLWPRLGFRWLRLMEDQLARTAFRAELGTPDHLMRLMQDGVLDISVMYSPQIRPGMSVERIIDDQLVLFSTDPDYGPDLDERYMFLDWGPEFAAAHALHFPDFRLSRVTLALGALAVRYVVREKRVAYLPARVAQEFVMSGHLHFINTAPVFPYPAYAVWTGEKDASLRETALTCLRKVAGQADSDQIELLALEGLLDDGLTTN